MMAAIALGMQRSSATAQARTALWLSMGVLVGGPTWQTVRYTGFMKTGCEFGSHPSDQLAMKSHAF